ncbi:MAG: hypothetical protein M1838_006238 [Thelocarpon superellum]|nr:MAG: hypothetical protein M1838_006238 [Thelocarpon superellum]
MSTPNETVLARHGTVDPADYDHQIFLLDTTQPEPARPSISISIADDLAAEPAESASPRTTETPLARKTTLREELAHRRYARWNEQRFSEADDSLGPLSSGSDGETSGHRGLPLLGRTSIGRRHTRRRSALKAVEESDDDPRRAVDILHENQRGWFVFGVPLFSHNSLLNFDPSPWTNVAFKNSPVDVTNAQVPDPSWVWEWKSWYVDMSGDVDDEGWQYSFSFAPWFAWHGRHVWFHSFVRRRRWLRARIKPLPRAHHHHRDGSTSPRTSQDMIGLHPDYFVVHSRPVSRASSVVSGSSREGKRRSSSVSAWHTDVADDIHMSSISDMDTLVKTLKSGRIDREKIEAVQSFLDHGGHDERDKDTSKRP